jgi:nucleoside-diphosphate-sugar epimerase
MTRALVIGGPGFVGQAACKELMRRGIETIAASRTDHPYGVFTSFRQLDRREPGALRNVLADVRPNVVLDLAAYLPGDVQDAMREFSGDRYVFISTGVYPSLHGRPAAEDDFVPYVGEPPADLDYREGKRWCESLLQRSTDFPWTIIRPPAILGPSDPSLRIAAYLQRVADGGALLVPQESYQWQAGLAWVRDIGFICALACDLRKPATRRAYNAAFDGVSLEKLVLAIGGAMGRKPQLVPVPFAELPAGASPYGPDPARSAGYALDRARAELGFEPSALDDAIADIMPWYQVRRPSHPGYAERARELALAAARRS